MLTATFPFYHRFRERQSVVWEEIGGTQCARLLTNDLFNEVYYSSQTRALS